jgi:PAS domain S-box-containing protein
MSWSQTPRSEDLHDQMTVLIGSAIRLLGGEAGVFVVSNEAFDPQSHPEYTPYRLDESMLPLLFLHLQKSEQPNSNQVLVIEELAPELALQLSMEEPLAPRIERCSLALFDMVGPLGVLHVLRANGTRSCFEQEEEEQPMQKTEGGRKAGTVGQALRLFTAQLATGVRFALRARSLVKEQGRFAAIFQHSTDGILTVDTALRILDFNPVMEQLTGWNESEVLGQFYFKVLRPKDRQGKDLGLQDSPILQAFAGQTVVNRDMILTTRDGERFDAHVTASCVRSAKGEPTNGILTVRDITREREQEEQRSTFVSVISHELQTPIAIIKGYASTLARADAQFEPKILRSRLAAIEEEADRLNKLVGNLLYASRIQANGLQMDVASLDLEPLVQKVVRRLSAKSPGVSITIDFPENLPAVMADRERIEEVLQNLLDNAIKYSPKERVIKISGRATGEETIISVSDAGMGISLRDQEQIFNRFHRVGDPMTRSTPGAGLGLYICRVIVEAHGGRIWVESTLRQGSVFSFSLPREEKAHLPMVVF